jgi:hypothetical protein
VAPCREVRVRGPKSRAKGVPYGGVLGGRCCLGCGLAKAKGEENRRMPVRAGRALLGGCELGKASAEGAASWRRVGRSLRRLGGWVLLPGLQGLEFLWGSSGGQVGAGLA